MNVSRRQLLTGAAALATAGLRARRAWAQAPTAAAAPQKGGQIIVGITQEPQNFNPVMPTIETQRGVHMAIFDDLWRIDGKGNFVPNLALTIPTQGNGGISRDGTVFTVKLRPGVSWHDTRGGVQLATVTSGVSVPAPDNATAAIDAAKSGATM